MVGKSEGMAVGSGECREGMMEDGKRYEHITRGRDGVRERSVCGRGGGVRER